ncbi:hypothetical protein GN316_06335 [Xylophilus sp. Kf1]|nr:hypothetical protein [Xylophilus sp. Kf1]
MIAAGSAICVVRDPPDFRKCSTGYAEWFCRALVSRNANGAEPVGRVLPHA